ncbi:MAG: TetM/TetW/TetO/TetS family tetracycline resistance ribosomal protection protein [Lachnospiraceae bacterium]|nr:TetM/TetW/TetO/TetS family tetracycline resistance ribosomal protection protein [Lachnospiraceae bacterium]
MKKNLVMGMLANVDAGKTTLSEALLYKCNAIRSIGRVDHGNAFLDTFELEKERGITIFSKQAVFETEKYNISLIDTPGHADFSSEMERTLSVLDLAVIIVSASDGITGQLRVIIRLLKYYKIPSIVFINKMDQPDTDKEGIINDLRNELKTGVIDFFKDDRVEDFYEEIAVLDEKLLEKYLDGKIISLSDIKDLVKKCQLIPVCSGSALKQDGIDNLIALIDDYAPVPEYENEFSGRIFKISREEGKKLCWIKITGGSLKVKTALNINGNDEKTDEIRIYSGSKFKSVNEAYPGQVCAVTGLANAREGMSIGNVTDEKPKLLESVMRYRIIFPENTDLMTAYKNFKMLEEEDPALRTDINRENNEISIELMGSVQAEIIKKIAKDRFDYDIEFTSPEVIYKETVAAPVEGVGHFEPLRHYSEVHLLIEPGEKGSGIKIETRCSTDQLAINYQKLIISILENKKFNGVLTGSELTDVRIILLAGKAHEKHTEGGDFREAVHRAVRQGLMSAENVLLEPVLSFSANLPESSIGKLMSDISEMGGSFGLPENNGDMAVLTGKIPASEYGDYSMSFKSYTGGHGNISVWLSGYEPCHNTEEILEMKKYDPEKDLENPSSSVFCMHGAGTVVPWNKVRDHMHIDSGWDRSEEEYDYDKELKKAAQKAVREKEDKRSFKEKELDRMAADAELKMIFERTYGPIKERNYNNNSDFLGEKKEKKEVKPYKFKEKERLKDYLLVDGYNIIFAWESLKSLASKDLKSARDKLLDILSNYAGISDYEIIVVFDAYKVPGGQRHIYRYNNIDVIFTQEAETADLYIEQAAKELGKKYAVTVATSDAIEQIIVFGSGARRLSAMNFYEIVKAAEKEIAEKVKDFI